MFKIKKILNGKIFLLSTDTVPGIGGILTEETKEKLINIKQGDKNKKFAILVSGIKQAQEFDEWNKQAEIIAKKYWPGALTIALKNYGLRMPKNKKIIKLLNKIGPIYLTSANMHCKSTLKYNDAKKFFKNDIKIFLNYAKNNSGTSSTIIQASTNKILRQGDIKCDYYE